MSDSMELLQKELHEIETGVNGLQEWCSRALELLEQIYKAPYLNDTNAIIEVENQVKKFLKENGREV